MLTIIFLRVTYLTALYNSLDFIASECVENTEERSVKLELRLLVCNLQNASIILYAAYKYI